MQKPSQKTVMLLIILVLCSTMLSGCDALDALKDLLTNESGKWRELAQVQAQGAIRAVPGERYLELIDAVHGTDEKKKTEAQQFLLRLSQLDRDPNTVWEATVTFTFDEKNPLRADGFWGFSDSRAQVEYFVQNAFNPVKRASTGSRLQTMDELNSEIDTQVDGLLNTLQGEPAISQTLQAGNNVNFTATLTTWPSSLTPTVVNPYGFGAGTSNGSEAKANAKKTRDDAARILKKLFKAQYGSKEIPVGATTLAIEWHPTEAKNMFFVLIPESDWLAHKNDKEFAVEVVMHKQGDLSQTFQKTLPFSVGLEQFANREPVELKFAKGKVRWAVIDPTHTSATIPDLSPEKIKNMENLLHLVNAVNEGTGNSGVAVVPHRRSLAAVLMIPATIFVLLLAVIGVLIFELRKARRSRRR
jgi:hypothetical protein